MMPKHLWKCLGQSWRSERRSNDFNFPVLFLKLEAVKITIVLRPRHSPWFVTDESLLPVWSEYGRREREKRK